MNRDDRKSGFGETITPLNELYEKTGISREVWEFGEGILQNLKERFEEIDRTAEYNQIKVIQAMQENRVSEACLYASSGYGYNDIGRETLKKCMHLFSVRRTRWYGLRSPAAPMRLPWRWPEICAPATSCFLRSGNPMIHWKK